jgi:hypothetical protein
MMMNGSKTHTPARVYHDAERRTIQGDVDEKTLLKKSKDDLKLSDAGANTFGRDSVGER